MLKAVLKRLIHEDDTDCLEKVSEYVVSVFIVMNVFYKFWQKNVYNTG